MVVSILTLLGALAIGLTWSISTMAILTSAPVALIMGGTGNPDPIQQPPYMQNVQTYYINQFSSCTFAASCVPISTHTPEQFWPVYGGLAGLKFDQSVAQGVIDLDTALRAQLNQVDPPSKVVIFGYSQSGTILTDELRDLQANPGTAPPSDQLENIVIGNPNRPHGGILSMWPGLHIPILDVTFNGPMPTDTGYKLVDISFKYDAISDFPQYPIDLLAVANALAGYAYIHGTYPSDNPYGYTPAELIAAMNDPANQQQFNANTTYITLPDKNLPILQPVRDIAALTGTGFLVNPLLDLVQPTIRVLIELGYNRTIPYGQPTTFGLIPPIHLIQLGADLVKAAVEGVQAAIHDIIGGPSAPIAPPTTSTPVNSPAENLSIAVNSMTNGTTDSAISPAKPESVTTRAPRTGPAVQTERARETTLVPSKPDQKNILRLPPKLVPTVTKPRERQAPDSPVDATTVTPTKPAAGSANAPSTGTPKRQTPRAAA